MAFAKKDPYEDLDLEWRQAVDNMAESDIRKRVSEIALERRVFVENKKTDQHIKELLAEKAKLVKPYKDRIDAADAKVQVAKTFTLLPEEFQKQVSEAAFDREQANRSMKEDPAVKSKSSEIKGASEGYTSQIKGANLRIRYALMVLGLRGKA